MLIKFEEYRRLKHIYDRQVLLAEDTSEEDLTEIAKGEIPAGLKNLDAELKG